MFSKSKLLAGALLTSAMTVAGVAAQTPTAPSSPQKIEREMQIFTGGGGGGSYLGIQSQDVDKENFSKYGLREVRGVAIEKVVEDSPAAKAGLQNGDVIVRFNGEEITSVRKLTRLISEVAPDHQARITISRGGNERELTATMGKRATPVFQNSNSTLERLYGLPGIPEFPRTPPIPIPDGTTIVPSTRGNGETVYFFGNNRQIGVGVSSLNKQLGEYFGAADGKGVLINNVVENSPASKAGLRAGDVIVEIDGKAVSGTTDLTRAINEKKEGDVTLTIIRNKNRQTIKVTPEKGKDNGLFEFYRQSDGAIAPSSRTYRTLAPSRTIQPQVLAPTRVLD